MSNATAADEHRRVNDWRLTSAIDQRNTLQNEGIVRLAAASPMRRS
jgi:hypothetical protein